MPGKGGFVESYRDPQAGSYPKRCGSGDSWWTPKDGKGVHMSRTNTHVRDLKITEKGGFSGLRYPFSRHVLNVSSMRCVGTRTLLAVTQCCMPLGILCLEFAQGLLRSA